MDLNKPFGVSLILEEFYSYRDIFPFRDWFKIFSLKLAPWKIKDKEADVRIIDLRWPVDSLISKNFFRVSRKAAIAE